MIKVNPAKVELLEFLDLFPSIDQKTLYLYFDDLELKKYQLFKLEYENHVSHMITSVTVKNGVRYFNVLELEGSFGWVSYPKEFYEMAFCIGKKFDCDELRIMLLREGAGRILKQYGFNLKYAEWGVSLK